MQIEHKWNIIPNNTWYSSKGNESSWDYLPGSDDIIPFFLKLTIINNEDGATSYRFFLDSSQPRLFFGFPIYFKLPLNVCSKIAKELTTIGHSSLLWVAFLYYDTYHDTHKGYRSGTLQIYELTGVNESS